MADPLVYDEFDDASIDAAWTDTDTGGATTVEEQGRLKSVVQVGGQSLQKQLDITLTDYDIYTKVEIPAGPHTGPNWCDSQIWFTDDTDGDLGASLAWDPALAEFQLFAWTDSNGFGDYTDEYVTIQQNYAWLRLKIESGVLIAAYYALEEPRRNEDWIDFGLTAGTPWVPAGQMDFVIAGNPDSAAVDKLLYRSFVRPWAAMGAVTVHPPGLEQYQRLQGYPKVTHPLVFNRNIGEFEVQEQARATSPAPTVDASYTLAYDGGGNLSTITMVVGGITYLKTLTYAAGNLSTVSVWVEQ